MNEAANFIWEVLGMRTKLVTCSPFRRGPAGTGFGGGANKGIAVGSGSDSRKMEQRINIKFYFKLGKTVLGSCVMLTIVYGDDAVYCL